MIGSPTSILLATGFAAGLTLSLPWDALANRSVHYCIRCSLDPVLVEASPQILAQLTPEEREQLREDLRRRAGEWADQKRRARQGLASPVMAGSSLLDVDSGLTEHERQMLRDQLRRLQPGPGLTRAGSDVPGLRAPGGGPSMNDGLALDRGLSGAPVLAPASAIAAETSDRIVPAGR